MADAIGKFEQLSDDASRGPLGILAGEGIFPLLVARGAKRWGAR